MTTSNDSTTERDGTACWNCGAVAPVVDYAGELDEAGRCAECVRA